MTTTATTLRFMPGAPEFPGAMCPGLRPVGQLLHGGDRPHHVVVDAENVHALQSLLYTHARKVDLICIDPPYDTGSWTPDDDRGAADPVRDSTWLAFMERRLVLAAGLLKEDGVLVVTIDEHEVEALALLLQRAVPGAEIERVALAINPGGGEPGARMHVDQYALFCFLGGANTAPGGARRITPGTVWCRPEHTGARLLQALLGAGGQFPFAKSVSVTRDAVRGAIGDRRDAVVLDFFAGSGTTMHAVALLNAEDGGSRQSISVTNNDVTAEDAEGLRRRGFQPGDSEWEERGTFRRVTRPRIEAAITGLTPAGDPIVGEYAGTSRPMAHGLRENAAFFELTYEDPDVVRQGLEFPAVGPLLWLRAGARGERITQEVAGWAMPDGGAYGVLFDTGRWREFASAIVARGSTVTHAFIVTDSATTFGDIRRQLPGSLDCSALYGDYLRSVGTCRPPAGGRAR